MKDNSSEVVKEANLDDDSQSEADPSVNNSPTKNSSSPDGNASPNEQNRQDPSALPLQLLQDLLNQASQEGQGKRKGGSQLSLNLLRRVTSSAVTTFEGPLPPPDLLRGYEDVLPGAAEQVFAMAKAEMEHRHALDREFVEVERQALELERKSLSDDFQIIRFGQICGLTIVLAALVASAIVAIVVPGWPGTVAGSVLGGTSLASLVAVFMRSRKVTPEESSKLLVEKSEPQKQLLNGEQEE